MRGWHHQSSVISITVRVKFTSLNHNISAVCCHCHITEKILHHLMSHRQSLYCDGRSRDRDRDRDRRDMSSSLGSRDRNIDRSRSRERGTGSHGYPDSTSQRPQDSGSHVQDYRWQGNSNTHQSGHHNKSYSNSKGHGGRYDGGRRHQRGDYGSTEKHHQQKRQRQQPPPPPPQTEAAAGESLSESSSSSKQQVLPSCVTGSAPQMFGDNFKRQVAGEETLQLILGYESHRGYFIILSLYDV